MTYPQPPEIQTSYTAQEQALGDGTLPGQELDTDLAAIRASITAIIEFMKVFTRSDGRLANGSVSSDTLASSLIIGFDPPALWTTGAPYTTRSTVFSGYGFYLCTSAHTSGVFATDLASGRWVLLADLTPPGGALIASNNLSDLPDKAVSRTNLQLGSMSTVDSGTGAAQFRTNLQNEAFFQAQTANLTAEAALVGAADRLSYYTGVGAKALTTLTSFARNLLDDVDQAAMRATLGAAQEGGITTTSIAAAALVTASETIAANNNDTTIPTSAAVAALVAAGWETRSTFNRITDVIATTRAETFEDGYDYLVLGRGVSRSDTAGLAVTLVFESTSTATDTETLTIPLGVAASVYAVAIEIEDPRSFQPIKVVDYSSGVMVAGTLTTGTTRLRATYGLGGGANDTRTDRLNSISIDLPTAVDAGMIWILRRPRT